MWLRPGETEFTARRAEASGIAALAEAMEAGARYWYLLMIGVRPECQGQGIGSALMRPALARADGEDLPCFVETVQPRNRPLYERHGFRLVWDQVDPESGLRLLSFWRPPRASGHEARAERP